MELHRLEKALGVGQLVERNAERQGFFDDHGDRATDLRLHAEALLCEAAFEAFPRSIGDERGCQQEQAAHQHNESALQVFHCAGFGVFSPSATAAARLRTTKSGRTRTTSSTITRKSS